MGANIQNFLYKGKKIPKSFLYKGNFYIKSFLYKGKIMFILLRSNQLSGKVRVSTISVL